MGYNALLADRIRTYVASERGLSEKKIFGGIAFLINGNMAIAASGQGGLLVRVDPELSDHLLAYSNCMLMEMRGRSMTGWLRVEEEDVESDPQLATWINRGVTYAQTLPAK